MLPDLFARDPERLARFEREARLLASLSHPNIPAIHDFGIADGVASWNAASKGPDQTISIRQRSRLRAAAGVVAFLVERRHCEGRAKITACSAAVANGEWPPRLVLLPTGAGTPKVLDTGTLEPNGGAILQDGTVGFGVRAGQDGIERDTG